MLKISHIKIVCINIFLLWLIGCYCACYLPQGAFIGKPINGINSPNDTIFISLPTEFQVYNYFKVTYVKNNEVFEAIKHNDSTIVFLANEKLKRVEKIEFRVEVGITPFFKKLRQYPLLSNSYNN